MKMVFELPAPWNRTRLFARDRLGHTLKPLDTDGIARILPQLSNGARRGGAFAACRPSCPGQEIAWDHRARAICDLEFEGRVHP